MSCSGGCSVRPCFCSLFLLFPLFLTTSPSNFFFFFMYGALASNCNIPHTAQVQVTHSKYRLVWRKNKISSGSNTKFYMYKYTVCIECVLGCVCPHVFIHQDDDALQESTGRCPSVCAAYCSILWSHWDATVCASLTCQERGSQWQCDV